MGNPSGRPATFSIEVPDRDISARASRQSVRYTRGLTPFDLKRARGERLGDSLVIRTGGSGGIPGTMARTLRSLTLYRVGSARVGYLSDPTFRGQVSKVRDYVSVVPLGLYAPSQAHCRKGIWPVTERDSYDSGTSIGEIVAFADGEHVQAEITQDNSVSTSWSSELAVGEIVGRALRCFGEPTDKDHAVVVIRRADGSTELGDGSSPEALGILAEREQDLVHLVLELGGVRLTWHEPYAKLAANDCVYAEVGCAVGDVEETKRIGEFVAMTATKRVRRDAENNGIHMELGSSRRMLVI